MDEVIFEEFKGTGNMELVLDRKIAERRIFPAIDIHKSGTRREELLFDDGRGEPRSSCCATSSRDMPADEAMTFLLQRMGRTQNNQEFFAQMAKG